MKYEFSRINLSKTNYQASLDWGYIRVFEPDTVKELQDIYLSYCRYKKFLSVMPLFPSRFLDPNSDVIGYWDNKKLVAWSLIKRFDQQNAMCEQFAWTYHRPKMRLGIESLKTECAIYKTAGFDYLYLDRAHAYKSQISGFETLGPAA